MSLCYANDCDRKSRASGLCDMHYRRFRKYGDPNLMSRGRWFNLDGSRKACSVLNCSRDVDYGGLCKTHASRVQKTGAVEARGQTWKTCPTPGCGREMVKRNTLCGKCNQDAWRYGLSPARFLEMRNPENMRCSNKACGALDNLHIDHDHSCPCQFSSRKKTKVSCGECVRGWLCRSCNLGLGFFNDNPELLQGISEYVKNWKTPSK